MNGKTNIIIETDCRTLADHKQSGRLLRKTAEGRIGLVIDLGGDIDKDIIVAIRNQTKAKGQLLFGKNFLDKISYNFV